MAFTLPINVHETTNTTGTGDLTLAGAVSGSRSFSVDLANGDETVWTLAPNGSTDREVHGGAWNTGGILTRSTSTLIKSTTGGLINLGAGPHDVYIESIPQEKVEIGIACSDETSDLTTGTAKATFRMPFSMSLDEVRSGVTTAPTGAALIVDINEGGVSVLSTTLSIDATEKTSVTAAAAAVISDSALADDAEITIDIDQVGSTVAGAGLKVWLIGRRSV